MRRAPVALLFLAACGRFDFATVEEARDASTVDGRDGATSDGASGVCSGADILCDTFDGPLAGWTPGSDGSGQIDPLTLHRGAGALHVHANAVPANTNGYFGIVRAGVIPAAATTLYARLWVRLSALPVNNMELLAFVQGGAGNTNEVGVFVVPNAFSIYSQFEEKSRDTGAVPALGTWTCLLWTVVRGAPGSLRLAGDVGPVQLTVITDGNPKLDELDLGIGFSGNTTSMAQPALDVWFDDLLVRDSAVTCAE